MTTTTAALQKAPAAKHDHQPRVVLVGQEPAFEAALTYVLEEEGFAVGSFASAREALSSMAQLPAEIVVFELDGEESDGFGFLDEIARVDSRVKVVVSARDPSVAQLDAHTRQQLGIDAVVQRPCRLDAIADTLRSLAPAASPREGASVPVQIEGTVARLSLARVTARANVGM